MTEDPFADWPEKILHKEAKYRGGIPLSEDSEEFGNYFYDAFNMDVWREKWETKIKQSLELMNWLEESKIQDCIKLAFEATKNNWKEKAEKWDKFFTLPLVDEAFKLVPNEIWEDYKNRLEAVKTKIKEWDETHMRDKHAAPSILEDLEKILGDEA